MSLLPVDVIGVLHDSLLENRRPPDGKLHASGDIVGSLRLTQLRLAGAPTIENPLTSEIVLQTGNFWHEYLGSLLKRKGVPVVIEVKLDPWMPEGWSGTADFLFYDPKREAWILADLKTQKGEANRFTRLEGAKTEHIHQVSAYWHALVNAGFPMVDRFAIIYLPKNDTTDKNDPVSPIIAECKPLDSDYLHGLMAERWKLSSEYAAVVADRKTATTPLAKSYKHYPENEPLLYLNNKLAPPQERIQKMYWNAKQEVFDVKLVPHWSADYCDFPNELCDCSEQGTTKIGHWYPQATDLSVVLYQPRKDYEAIEPTVKPTDREWKRRYPIEPGSETAVDAAEST